MASKSAKIQKTSGSSHERTNHFYIPGDIIEEILAYLPLKEAAGLSILSKRFVNSWKLCRNLSFTREISRRFSKEEFIKLISDFVLNFTDKGKMHRFSLCIDPTEHIDLVQSWVHKAIECGITELELDFTVAEQTYMLSFFLSQMENLKLLKLNKCELDFVPMAHGLCHVQQITLQNIRVPPYTLDAMFSDCLKLQTLELINCQFIYCSNFLAQKLKGFAGLVVKNCTGHVLMRMNAPTLCKLHYEGKICEIKFESELPALTDVALNITSPRSFQLIPHRSKVMIALANVRTLAVNHTFLEALCARFGQDGYREMDFFLWKLKDLQLLIGGESNINPLDIAIFIKKCPCVERVLIDLGKYALAGTVYWERHARTIFMGFGAPFSFLAFVKIKGFSLKDMHLAMARLFVKNAPCLRSLEIFGARNDASVASVMPLLIAGGLPTNAKVQVHEYVKDKTPTFPIHV